MIVFPYPIPTCLLSLKPSWWCTWFLKTNFVVRDHHPPKIILKWFQSYTERIYIILYRFVWKLVLQPPMVYRHNFPVKHCHQFGRGIPPFETHTSTLLKHWGTPFHATAHHHPPPPPPPPGPQPPPPHLIQQIWTLDEFWASPSTIFWPKKW